MNEDVLAGAILYSFVFSGLLIAKTATVTQFFERTTKNPFANGLAFLTIIAILADILALGYTFAWAVGRLVT